MKTLIIPIHKREELRMNNKRKLAMWNGKKAKNIPVIRKFDNEYTTSKNIIKIEPNGLSAIPQRDDKVRAQDQKNTQENTQDLDQTQNVDITPSQNNIQNLQVTVNNKLENYSGKITGITYGHKGDKILDQVSILVYFGSTIGLPVYNTKSDADGKFAIEDLPAGYYTIKASKGEGTETIIYNIKVLPGQNCYNFISLNNV
jgi:hypothetical protein